MQLKLWIGCGAALVVLAAAFLALQANKSTAGSGLLPYDDAASVALGKVLYGENCASCHGSALEGQPDWKGTDADGFMPAPPHDETGHTWHHADRLLYMITKFGTAQVVGDGYKSNMIGFTDILSDEEILQTLGYIKSTWSQRVIDMHNSVNDNANAAN